MNLSEHLHPDMQILFDARDSVGINTTKKSVANYRTFWEQYYRAIPNPRPDTIEIDDFKVAVEDCLVLDVGSDQFYQLHVDFPAEFGLLMINLARELSREIEMLEDVIGKGTSWNLEK
jgi:hypothetical protein